MHVRLPKLLVILFGLTLLYAFYSGVATQFRYGPWPISSCGRIFDAQALALLAGRMHLDPAVLGGEAFLRDGHSYTYFGILPALMRMPLLRIGNVEWTAPSCALAATLAAMCLLCALRDLTRRHTRGWPLRIAVVALASTYVLSGPQFELTSKPTVYTEAILWGYAFNCAFLWRALKPLRRAGEARHFALLGALAAAALMARVTAGLALYTGWALLALLLVWNSAPGARATAVRRLLPGVALLTIGILAVGAVNYARWGNPLVFADLARNITYATSTDRSARLARYGNFEAERVPYAFDYYFTPRQFRAARAAGPDAAAIRRLFDNAEGPPASQLLIKLAWWTLAGVALTTWFLRRRLATRRVRMLALAAAFCVPAIVVLAYGYLAFRFGAEFAPLAALGSLAGVSQRWTACRSLRASVLATAFALALCATSATQIWQSWRVSADYVASDYTDNVCD